MVRPIIISGPSGSGKSTLLSEAIQKYPNTFAFSVSHTTRKPRPSEIDGEHYYFTDYKTMKQMIDNNELFEYAEFSGNLYGTSKKVVENIQKSGKICVLDIELQGVKSFKQNGFDAKYILILPSSIDSLEKRLRKRGTETEESIQKRIDIAKKDLQAVESMPNFFDHKIINDVMENAYNEFINLISDELKEYQQNLKK